MPFSLYTDFQSDYPDIVSSMKVTIEGELTIYEASEFKEKLNSILKNSPVVLEINLSKIQKIDSSCLQVLLAFKKEVQIKDREVQFVDPSHNVLNLMDLYGIAVFLADKTKLSSRQELEEFSFDYGRKED
ncbi:MULTISPECIES: STAS domain-containing protein [Leptospira]|uniref:Anti-anti-sigma factor n=1 Tax=Leptospira kirschneri serovar Pomona TaxID=561005 RepID=A0A1T1DNU1_9LEPT|nr:MULTISPECIES: STAS domain-containing protein [Leptospira]EMJ89512.1 STAS domain protein [Leptospira kirschneri str. JB]EMK09991.1 STAS domain protein [Leptospira kirschneri]KXZ25557.1 anti-anti-sigma factor [Leptospira kirschneri]KXZ29445.1 anti-anti-sigma factor [Leptospira sp. ZV016]OOV42502.1 anti-anti-sigma factor [Leptospira kirschneri serovar Pomona]